MPYRDDDYDRLSDGEYPDPDEDEDDDLAPCPACGAAIYEDSVRCPACGHYGSAGGRKPLWVVVTALVCLAMALGWALSIG